MIDLNKMLKKICASVVFTTLLSSSVCFADYNMKIDENKYIKHIDRLMYGINQEWSTVNGPYYLKDGPELDINPEFIKCYKDSIALARMAGTSSDWVKWKNNIGDLSQRRFNKLWGTMGIVKYGMVEWLKSIQQTDPDAKLTYVVNIISDSYENMADAIEFLTGDGTVNYNGGINWAQFRIASGVKEPIEIYTYEIGNETDTTGGGGLSLDEYIERAKKAISVIRSIDRNAKIAVHNNTANITESYDYYEHRLLQELGDQIDYISFHGYYVPDERDLAGPTRKFSMHEKRVARMEESIKTITGSDRIKLYMSEHACGRYNSETTAGYDFVFPHTMMGTMYSAEWLLRMMWYPSLEASTYHSTESSSWCIAYSEDGTIKMSAIGNLLQLMQKYGVGDVCASTLDGFVKFEYTDVSAQAVKNDEGLNVILVNKNAEPQTVNFTFNNKYKVKNIAYIHSDDYKADNYKGTRGIDVVWNVPIPEGEFNSYTMDNYSITFITLEEISQEQAVTK